MRVAKIVLYSLWAVAVIAVLVTLIVKPSLLAVDSIVSFVERFHTAILLVYIILSLVRGLFLLPSTPFVLAGIALFPESPILVITISMIGIVITATALYYFSDLLGFSEKLDRKFPKQMERWHRRLNSGYSTWIVMGWSFFPFVPTDLICYVAGIVKMPFRWMILGLFIGELVLVSCYAYLGVGFVEYLKG